MTAKASQVWADMSAFILSEVSEAVWNSTFKDVEPVDLVDDMLILSVPSQMVRQRMESRYTQLLEQALSESDGSDLTVQLEVHIDRKDPAPEVSVLDDSHGGESPTSTTAEGDVRSDQTVDNHVQSGQSDGRSTAASGSTSGDRFTFENFVIGPTNRFAHAASLAVAENPARSYNPLFVYGSAGLGKTHLLLAIANYVREIYPSYQIRYISSETMLNEFVDAIRQNSQNDFKRRLRGIDVLLVDDIQFMEGKEQLQDEFFHTFNSLQQAQKQIVLSSDRPPDAIKTLEDRLRSRFKQGLITDIQPPDFETRLAIIQKKQEQSGIEVPEEILEFIATHVTYNIRELEGALTKVRAYMSLNNVSIDLDMARTILADSLTTTKPRMITPELIIDKAAELFAVDGEQIRGKSRTRDLVHARQVGMYVCRTETDLSFPQIGRAFGGRDHTTVMHAVEKITSHMAERQKTYDDVVTLTKMVRAKD